MSGRDEGQRAKEDLIDVIVIDPGHGGPDSGAVGSKGLVEKEVTLDIAQRLRRLLQKEQRLKIILTRTDDVLVPLEERTAIANRNAADLLVSIHTNASPKRSAHGSQTFFLSAAKTDEGRAAAAAAFPGSRKFLAQILDAGLDIGLEVIRALVLRDRPQHLPQAIQAIPGLTRFSVRLFGLLVFGCDVRGHTCKSYLRKSFRGRRRRETLLI